MKRFLFSILVAFSVQAMAVTKATFFGFQTMIQVVPTDSIGSSDLDSVELYRAMNVPIQDSFMGKGKSIVAANKALNFVCALRTNNTYECTIVLNRSPFTSQDPINKNAKFEVTGPLADELRKLFFLNQGEFRFRSSDNVMKVEATQEKFLLEYSKQGV